MPRVASFAIWLALLMGLWVLLVGTTQTTELVAGLVAAALRALVAETLRTMGLLGYAVDPGVLGRAWRLPWQLVLDFAVLTWVLVRSLSAGRRVRGV